MGRVAGVFDNPPGFSCTPPGVDILEGGKLTSNNVAGSSHDPLQSPAVASGAVSKPGVDAAHRMSISGIYRISEKERYSASVLGKVTFKSNALQYCVTP